MKGSVQSEQEQRKNLETALKGLIKLIKAIRFYPPAHPALKAAAEEAHAGFPPLLQNGAPLVLQVRKEGFFLGESPVSPDNLIMQKLSSFLFARRIQRLTILPDLSSRDLRAFAGCLSLDPRKLQKAGGIQEVLQKALISTLWVNEVDLERIQARKDALEAEKDRLISQGLTDTVEALFADQPEVSQKGESGPAEGRGLKQVIAELQVERSDQRYQQLLQELVPLVPPNLNEANRLVLLHGLTLLCKNAGMQQKSEVRREASRHALKQLLTDALLDFLLAFLCARDLTKESRDQLARVLVFLGGDVARRLMERLAEERDAQARKLLADALLQQGAAAIPVLIDYLDDERWYVVRNAIAILGELRAQTAIAHFHPLLGHLDVRVRREAIRALTRIGGNEAVDILLQIVQKGDPDLRPHALLSLGAMKNPAAVPTLLQIVAQPDPWVKMVEVKKEAIRALGEIGAPEALPTLVALLQRRKLWRGALFNELRAAAALALGDIGHASAAEALKAAADDRSSTVARVAVQALKQLRKV
jgi:HEAT repeat protein